MGANVNSIFDDLDKDIFGPKKDDSLKLAFAFYQLYGGVQTQWNELPDHLKNSPGGKMCQLFIETNDPQWIEKAGIIIGGENWRIAFGRSF